MPSGHQAQLHQDGLLCQPAVRRGGGRSAAWARPAREQGLIKWKERWPFRSAPESLDPRTLRLLWRQRELEIQALRWAIENHREARHCRILQEVAGLPAERSSCSRKLLQNQVQKLTLELEEQKGQAQLEKAHLEKRLLQTRNTLQQLEAELQALQKSCLLQLARSSWVGRMLRSSTGSVEVVTAETLMDPSDLSENDRPPTAGEGFRLENVDWNSVAHRYPNLFTNLESSSDQQHPWAPPLPELPPATQPDQWNSELYCRQSEHRLKSVEWSSLPLVGTSSSGGADSESSSCLLAARYHVQKVTGDPLQAPGHIAEQKGAQSLCGDSRATWEGRLSLDLRKTHSDRQGKNGQEPESRADPHPRHYGRCPSPTGSCLKIMAVSHRRGFVRILNQSLEETADLGGFVLQQLVRDFPVCMYRFPPSTLLEPRQHITDLRRQHRLVHRPFPALRGPARCRPRGAAAPASTPAQGSGAGGPGRAPEAGDAGSVAPPEHQKAPPPARGARAARGRRRDPPRAPALQPHPRPRWAGRAWTAAVRWWRCRCRARPRAGSASASSAARPSPRTRAGRCRAGRGGGSGACAPASPRRWLRGGAGRKRRRQAVPAA
ncbi:lamin tail domain-containing protein 2 isoform X5 [Sagmatias obliquidens]|uniref:lamin tail domain-containing protein 2 isoform X5 n=1 Tax=Sagmatias obliquidens TaxID=3371155 RepID=UPI000F443F7D|nr:lamin tail domain-containing protein 2 isoform X5 [Lagenorhynchus obliquidens]